MIMVSSFTSLNQAFNNGVLKERRSNVLKQVNDYPKTKVLYYNIIIDRNRR